MALKGYNLVLSSRKLARLTEIKESLMKQHSIKVEVIQSDLAINGGPKKLWNDCNDQGYQIEILINNAGSGLFGECTELDSDEVEAMLYLNIQALTTLCGLFGKQMKERRSGNILNVGSMAANQATPFFACYDASKTYVQYYSLALRHELRPYGINVSSIEPGYVSTAFDASAKITSAAYLNFSKKHSLTPEVVAKKGLQVMFKKKSHRIIGLSNKLSAFFMGLIPKSLKPVVLYKIVSNIIKE